MMNDDDIYREYIKYPCVFDKDARYIEPTNIEEYKYKIENQYCDLYKSIFEKEERIQRCQNPPYRCISCGTSYSAHLYESRLRYDIKQTEMEYKVKYGQVYKK